ncbi:hypothetical protein Agub_g12854 [Astrephomene gubernaculifera]|uniref:DUF1990 domain-containing protein n=1 Tax=Astrephomene gubernaculifera TaxID=47775 RepID=A0AAD3DYX6_9CHLO|nr:hypothetical protein Agub_g12854 [Astrephomene gubernaculifera]
MVLLALTQPTCEDEERVKKESASKPLNYAHVGTTRDPVAVRQLADRGWVVDAVSVRVGQGDRAFRAACSCLHRWGHFQLGWARVRSDTGTRQGCPVAVTSRTLFMWSCNPLRIVYSVEQQPPRFRLPWQPRPARSFRFAHGCVEGHLLAGEESFGVEMRPDGSVWYDITTFSRPIHPLAIACYPLTRHFQKKFGADSAGAMLAAVAAAAASGE